MIKFFFGFYETSNDKLITMDNCPVLRCGNVTLAIFPTTCERLAERTFIFKRYFDTAIDQALRDWVQSKKDFVPEFQWNRTGDFVELPRDLGRIQLPILGRWTFLSGSLEESIKVIKLPVEDVEVANAAREQSGQPKDHSHYGMIDINVSSGQIIGMLNTVERIDYRPTTPAPMPIGAMAGLDFPAMCSADIVHPYLTVDQIYAGWKGCEYRWPLERLVGPVHSADDDQLEVIPYANVWYPNEHRTFLDLWRDLGRCVVLKTGWEYRHNTVYFIPKLKSDITVQLWYNLCHYYGSEKAEPITVEAAYDRIVTEVKAESFPFLMEKTRNTAFTAFAHITFMGEQHTTIIVPMSRHSTLDDIKSGWTLDLATAIRVVENTVGITVEDLIPYVGDLVNIHVAEL